MGTGIPLLSRPRPLSSGLGESRDRVATGSRARCSFTSGSAVITGGHRVLGRLREQRGGVIHVVDPFKVPVEEAIEKAIAIERSGMAALILASTDYEAFDDHMPRYIAAVKEVVEIPVLLHFPPTPGVGVPIACEADGVIIPALLGSEDDYYVWKSLLETFTALHTLGGQEDSPELILSAALTFGTDQVSYDRMATVPVEASAWSMGFYSDVARLLSFDLVYLYSRYTRIAPEVCRFFRDHLHPEQLLFVSGGVRTQKQVRAYLHSGADYVAFAGALERPDWRTKLDELCSMQSLRTTRS